MTALSKKSEAKGEDDTGKSHFENEFFPYQAFCIRPFAFNLYSKRDRKLGSEAFQESDAAISMLFTVNFSRLP